MTKEEMKLHVDQFKSGLTVIISIIAVLMTVSFILTVTKTGLTILPYVVVMGLGAWTLFIALSVVLILKIILFFVELSQ